MNKSSNGFTLIKLMIVIAIIGIIATVAIPLYQSNIVKTQLNRSVSELAAYRTAFETQLSRSETVTNAELGYVPSELTTGTMAVNIGVINGDGSGHLEVTMGGTAHPLLTGVTVRYERSSSGSWSCIIDKSATGDWRDSYSPATCVVR